jgi:hypothetical protein
MTVRDLIARLGKIDPMAEVFVAESFCCLNDSTGVDDVLAVTGSAHEERNACYLLTGN